ncbi:MAG: enoyl-CoA hydratase/isomerase family protein [Candidatus Aminicenantes bacterium]
MAFKNLITKKENDLGWIIINRPDKLNALNAETVKELTEAFLSFQHDQQVKAVILTGSGEKAFAAGADIKELSGLDSSSGKDYVLAGQKLTRLMENFKKPVMAAVNGFALGGGTEMALACHVRIASDNAKMGQPEVKLGLIPGFGGTQRLARLVGKGKAMEIILSGRMIDAEEALESGLVNRVVPSSELLSTCEDMAREMTANAPLALQYAIQAINEGLDISLEEGLRLEADLFGKSCATQDSKEGTQAFLEKRKANFQGK